MKHINTRRLEMKSDWPPEVWQTRALDALNELRQAADGNGRAQVFRRYGSYGAN